MSVSVQVKEREGEHENESERLYSIMRKEGKEGQKKKEKTVYDLFWSFISAHTDRDRDIEKPFPPL